MKRALAAAALFALSCAPKEAPPPPAAPTMTKADQLSIQEGTQARVAENLQIGAGNFWEQDGQLTCGLWFNPSQEHTRVRAGDALDRAGHHIEVVEVTRAGGGKGVVVLKVSP